MSLGTFDALMDFSISQGSSVNQYKTPRCVTSEGALKIFDSEGYWEVLKQDMGTT